MVLSNMQLNLSDVKEKPSMDFLRFLFATGGICPGLANRMVFTKGLFSVKWLSFQINYL